MLPILSNAFNDPSNPWYYVIGILFLLLIFGAVGFYIFWTGKKNKNADKEQSDKVNADTTTDTAQESSEQEAAPAATEEQQSDKE